ncbi:MAG: hypothetical protein ACSHYB_19540 [Roseibacillus sp.]
MKIIPLFFGTNLVLATTGFAQLSLEPASNSLSFTSLSESQFSVSEASNKNSAPMGWSFDTTERSGTSPIDQSSGIKGYSYINATFAIGANFSTTFFRGNEQASDFALLNLRASSECRLLPLASRVTNPADNTYFLSTDEGTYLEFGFHHIDSLLSGQDWASDLPARISTLEIDSRDTDYQETYDLPLLYEPISMAEAQRGLTISF